MQFEVPPSTAGAGIGVLNHSRLFEVRQLFGWHPLTPERWKLFLIDNAQWYNSDWGVAASYPLGWAIVYYMWTEHRDGYAKYLQKVFGREEVLDRTQRERELQDCFGTLDDKWFKKFYEFLDSLELRPSLCGPEEEEAAKVQNIAFHRTRLGKNKDSGTKEGGESGGGGGGGGRGKPR